MPVPLTVKTVTDGAVVSPLTSSAPVDPVSLPLRVTLPVSLALPTRTPLVARSTCPLTVKALPAAALITLSAAPIVTAPP